MKHLILTIGFLVILCSFSADKKQNVYVCTGKWATCYHIDKECEGLAQCRGEIKQVTLYEAKKMGRSKPCGFCGNKRR